VATDTQREKRRVILRAAITVFARHGYHTSRVADVAREAGVAYGLVYHYFQSKEDLLETIFRRTWSRMLEAVQRVEQEEATAREQLASVARIVLGAWQADPDLVRVLVREIARSPQLGNEVDEVEHAFAALERIVARGQQRGELRADVDPRLAAWILYGALEEILTGWVVGRLPGGEADVEHATRTVVAVLSDGLCVPGPRA
jgi:TetR/AcrR family transcriptional regulator, fatty acid metabolism regulator protein